MDLVLKKMILVLIGFAVVGTVLYYLMRSLTRHFVSGMRDVGNHLIRSFFHGLSQIELQDEEKPKTLPQIENLVLPKILKDFPDFDLAMAKNQVKDHLMGIYGNRDEFQIHDVALVEYRETSVKRALVFYAAVSWRREKLLQKKLKITMEFQCINDRRNPAINCPNCGAALGFDDLECKYCGTRINDRRDQEWGFAGIREI